MRCPVTMTFAFVLYKDYPGLGIVDRSFTPTWYSSVGNTFTFHAVEDTGSNLNSNASFLQTLARASLKPHLPGSPGIETKRTGQRTAVDGTDAPKIPSFRAGGSVIRVVLGWVIDRSFTSGDNTFTSYPAPMTYIYALPCCSLGVTLLRACTTYIRSTAIATYQAHKRNTPINTIPGTSYSSYINKYTWECRPRVMDGITPPSASSRQGGENSM